MTDAGSFGEWLRDGPRSPMQTHRCDTPAHNSANALPPLGPQGSSATRSVHLWGLETSAR